MSWDSNSVTFIIHPTTIKAGDSALVTFFFDRDIEIFPASAVTVAPGCTLSGLVCVRWPDANPWHLNSVVWTARLTPDPGVERPTNALIVDLTEVKSGGNFYGVGTATSGNYAVDSKRPTLAADRIEFGSTAFKAGESTTVLFHFSEAVTGFDAADVDVPHGTLSNVQALDAGNNVIPDGAAARSATWQATLTPDVSSRADSNRLTVYLDGVSDAAGNAGVDSVESASSYAVDTERPTLVSYALGSRWLGIGASPTVSFSFSEPVKTFDAAKITVPAACTLSAPLPSSPVNGASQLWTATLTVKPDAQSALANTIDLDLAGVTGLSGNTGAGHTSVDFDIDTVRPTQAAGAITMDSAVLGIGAITTVTFTFSKKVQRLDLTKVTLPASCRLSDLDPVMDGFDYDGVSSTIWKCGLTVKPGAQSVASNTLGLDLTGVQDRAGNEGRGISPATANFAIDTTRPLFDHATVSGERLVLHYTENMSLDAANEPRPEDFLVYANDRFKVISAVDVDAANNTVTLTLARAVTNGQTVTVGYTDPSVNNDNRAIQDTAGNDAANLLDQTVRNDTPAQPPPDDSTPPLLDDGHVTVNGDQLVLGYTDVNDLDTQNKAPPAAFTITVDGNSTSHHVIAVQVANAAAKTVTLTLDHAVAYGQTVQVAYTDPDTSRNDPNAIQDTAGNDAASFANHLARNETAAAAPSPSPPPSPPLIPIAPSEPPAPPAPPAAPTPPPAPVEPIPPAPLPAPPAAPTPSAPPPAQPPTSPAATPAVPTDSDHDGASNAVENRAPGLPGADGAPAQTGDGNGDGVQDSLQPAVASNSFVVSPEGAGAPADTASTWATLVAGDQNGKPGADPGAITSLEQKDAPTGLPQALVMPIGLLDFGAAPGTLLAASAGSSEAFSLHLDPALHVNGYWLQDPQGSWLNLASAPQGGRMATEGGRLRLDFAVTDGGPFDADHQIDGSISARGAPAYMPLSITGQPPDAGQYGFWI